MSFSVSRRVLSSAAAVALLLAVAGVALPRTEHALGCALRAVRLPAVASKPEALRSPGLVDPLAPRRPPLSPARDGPPRSDADDAAARRAGKFAAWPRARPARDYQYSRTRKERGVLPCEAPDPGFGVQAPWVHVRPMGQFVAPRGKVLAADGGFGLVVHFHGHRPARKEFVRSGEDLVLLGVSLGIGAAYGPPFARPERFETLVLGVERALSKREGRPAHVRRIALSSWSRGYEAIAQILEQPIAAKVDALILLDSLHASRDPVQGRRALEPFADFAAKAARGETFFFVSHSSIDTTDYASTTETARYLVAVLGGIPVPALRKDPLGLELFELYDKGQFHERGYTGNGKLDHCAHFGVYAEVIQALARRWR